MTNPKKRKPRTPKVAGQDLLLALLIERQDELDNGILFQTYSVVIGFEFENPVDKLKRLERRPLQTIRSGAARGGDVYRGSGRPLGEKEGRQAGGQATEKGYWIIFLFKVWC